MRIALLISGAVLLVILVVALVQLNRDVHEQIDVLATANSDSTQWSLAQSDVEVLALLNAVTDAQARPGAPLVDVRTRFDIFYSRARTLFVSPILSTLREEPAVIDALSRLEAYLNEMVPFIDGTDAGLRAALPELKRRTRAARLDVRDVNLKGVNVLSSAAQTQRGSIAETLSRVSLLTFALFAILVLMVFLLLHFFRRAQRRAVEQSQIRSRLGAMLSTSLDAVVAVNTGGKIIDFNGAAEEIFGYKRADVLGRQMEDLIIPDHLKHAHAAGMERYLTTREKHVVGKGRVQLEARRKNGEVFPVELSIETADSDEGEIFVSFLRDISRRVAAEKELIKARDDAVAGEKAKADLIAVMSHEMRTPLNGMLGTLDLMDPETHSSKDREYLDIIRASGKLLLHHVDNVLEISRAEAGKLNIEQVTFSVPALIRELVESQQGVSDLRGNRLSKSIEMQGDDYAIGDPTRIRQVLLNLVGNAIKFTRNGSITVEAKRVDEGDLIEFRVTDTGIGIPPDAREKIFEDFVTLDPSFSRAVGGTGLGLAIARRLIKAMNGKVGLESTSGYGSSFWVHLPLPSVPAPETSATAVPDGRSRTSEDLRVPPMKILVVEDNRINRIVAKDLLAKDDHKVDEAFDGQQGVELARRNAYDLVLMDISMPVMDGIEATRAIRANEPAGTHLPIVALTANAVPSEKDRFFAAGLDDILIKPISHRSLRETLAKYSQSGARTGGSSAKTDEVAFEATVDHAHLRELAGALGAEKIDALVKSFLDETGAAIEDIAKHIGAGDITEGLQEKIHHIAGSAALLGAEVLRTLLVELENQLVDAQTIDPSDAETLTEVWAVTVPELRFYLQVV